MPQLATAQIKEGQKLIWSGKNKKNKIISFSFSILTSKIELTNIIQ